MSLSANTTWDIGYFLGSTQLCDSGHMSAFKIESVADKYNNYADSLQRTRLR